MNCPDCKAAMKPLFTGFYCPNDCDKPELKAAKKPTNTAAGIIANIKKDNSTPGFTYRWATPINPVTGNHAAAKRDIDCPLCGVLYLMGTKNNAGIHYTCKNAHTWYVPYAVKTNTVNLWPADEDTPVNFKLITDNGEYECSDGLKKFLSAYVNQLWQTGLTPSAQPSTSTRPFPLM